MSVAALILCFVRENALLSGRNVRVTSDGYSFHNALPIHVESGARGAAYRVLVINWEIECSKKRRVV